MGDAGWERGWWAGAAMTFPPFGVKTTNAGFSPQSCPTAPPQAGQGLFVSCVHTSSPAL